MRKPGSHSETLPHGPLRQALQIEREEKIDTVPLSIKLQEELTKPLNEEIREESVNSGRIGKLKAPVDSHFVLGSNTIRKSL